MPDIKITIGGDATQLDAALKKSQAELAKTAIAANKTDSSLQAFTKNTGSSIFNLTEKLKQLQSGIFTEKDRGKIALYNQQIKETRAEISKLNALGEGTAVSGIGGGAFSGIVTGANKAFGAIRKLAYILPGVGIAGIIGFATEPIINYVSSLFGASEAEKKAVKYAEDLRQAHHASAEATAKEAGDVISLIAVLNNQNESYKRKSDAIAELKKIQPEYFAQLSIEKGEVIGLQQAYQAYLSNLKNVFAAKILQSKLDAELLNLVELEGAARTKQEKKNRGLLNFYSELGDASTATEKKLRANAIASANSLDPVLASKGRIKDIIDSLSELSKAVKVPEIKVKELKVKVEKVKMDPILAELIKNRDTDLKTKELKISPILEIDPIIKYGDFEKRMEAYRDMLKAQAKRLESFKDLFANVGQDILVSFAEGIGKAATGGGLKGFFDSIFKTVGDGLKKLGVYFLAGSKLIQKIKELITKVPALSAVAALGLIALGTAISAGASKQGFASGTTGVARGGFFPVGERGPENIYLPAGAKVQPNNELKAYGGNDQGGFVASTVLQGSDIVILVERARAQMNRNGGVASYG